VTAPAASPARYGRLNLPRRIQARAATAASPGCASIPPELADVFQNQRRQELAALEAEFEMAVEVTSPRSAPPDERTNGSSASRPSAPRRTG
jgi:hypothetical protein